MLSRNIQIALNSAENLVDVKTMNWLCSYGVLFSNIWKLLIYRSEIVDSQLILEQESHYHETIAEEKIIDNFDKILVEIMGFRVRLGMKATMSR